MISRVNFWILWIECSTAMWSWAPSTKMEGSMRRRFEKHKSLRGNSPSPHPTILLCALITNNSMKINQNFTDSIFHILILNENIQSHFFGKKKSNKLTAIYACKIRIQLQSMGCWISVTKQSCWWRWDSASTTRPEKGDVPFLNSKGIKKGKGDTPQDHRHPLSTELYSQESPPENWKPVTPNSSLCRLF